MLMLLPSLGVLASLDVWCGLPAPADSCGVECGLPALAGCSVACRRLPAQADACDARVVGSGVDLLRHALLGVRCGLPAPADAHDVRFVGCRCAEFLHQLLLMMLLTWVSGVEFLHQLMLMILASLGVGCVPAPADAHYARFLVCVWCRRPAQADAHMIASVCVAWNSCTS